MNVKEVNVKKTIISVKSLIACFIVIANTSGSLASLEVADKEVRTADPVLFENYVAPGAVSTPVDVIKSIGSGLAEQSDQNTEDNRWRYFGKYSIIRAVSENDDDRFSADIFSIDKDARVTHIKFVVRMIQGYLEKKYEYSAKDAETLAFYVVYYNAVYRSDIEYFKERYKPVVMQHLSQENAGIARSYKDWPGKTRILIPLSAGATKGDIDAVDTEEISDDKVDEEIKEDGNDDKREDMNEIKEKVIDKKKDEIKEKEDEIKEKKDEIKEDEEELEKKKEDLKEKKDDAEKTTDPEEKKKKEDEIKEDEEEIKEDEEAVEEKKKQVKEDEEQLEEDKKQVKEDEDNLEEDKKDLENEKTGGDTTTEDTTTDDKTDEDEEDDQKKANNVYGNYLYYLKVKQYEPNGHYHNRMYMIDAVSRKIVKSSPDDTICGRKYDLFKEGIAVITSENNNDSAHHLTLLDLKTLQPVVHSKENIFWRSFVEIEDNKVYAIVEDNKSYYLGMFDKNLKLLKRSIEKINADTFITFFEDTIYINHEDKSILVLKKSDLSRVAVINP